MQRWFNSLYEVKKKDEEKRKEEEHQKLVSRIVACVGGRRGLLHKITKPIAGRGRLQILEEEDEDVRSLARCEEKKTEWAEHWQHNTDVQDLKDNPWTNEEQKCLEEGMPRLKEGDSEKAARNHVASTGV